MLSSVEMTSQFLLTIGGILLIGLLTSTLAHRTPLPRITLLLLFGMVIGGELLDIIPPVITDRFEIIADMTLLMVGFLIGGKLGSDAARNSAGRVLWISIGAALMTTLVVCLGLMLAGVSRDIAIILGCIAAATAPAAVLDVVEESGTDNAFTGLLLSIVALDDIWALALFGIGLSIVETLNGPGGEMSFMLAAAREIGGAALLGLLLGLPAAFLTGRIRQGQPMLTEAVGIVFICGGLALWLGVSHLIASMVMGAVIAGFARHHEYPFHAIEGIEGLFMVIFFVLAGASLELGALMDIGLVGAVYILCRAIGKYLGAGLGSHISRADRTTGRWMGAALLPQAGVSIGMALVASGHFPEYRQLLLSVVISSTVFFEIVGPPFTHLAIKRARSSGDI